MSASLHAARAALCALALLTHLTLSPPPSFAQADEDEVSDGDSNSDSDGDSDGDGDGDSGGDGDGDGDGGEGEHTNPELLTRPVAPSLSALAAPRRQTPFPPLRANDPRWGDHIIEHSALEVRPEAAIRVRLSAPRVDARALSATPAPQLLALRLTPSAPPKGDAEAPRPSPEPAKEPAKEPAPVMGITYWSAPDELSFKPHSPLKVNQAYEVTLTPAEALGLPADLGPFTFRVIATPPRVSVEPLALQVAADDPDALELRSRLTLSDPVAPSQVEEVIKVIHAGVQLPVRWEHDPKGLAHSFSARVERFEEPSHLEVRANLYAAGAVGRYAERLSVPALGAFTLTRAVAVRAPGQHARLYFSQPLDPRQDLAGLVRAEGVELDLAVSDSHLIVTPRAPVTGALELVVEPGLRDTRGVTLGQPQRHTVNFQGVKPALRATGEGVILPSVESPIFSFESVGLKSVYVSVLLVKEPNLGHFLQSSSFADQWNLSRVGRLVWQRALDLKLSASQLNDWQRHSVDMSALLREHPNALFNINVRANRADAAVSCSAKVADDAPKPHPPHRDREDSNGGYSAWESDGFSYWRSSENPCNDLYYRGARISQNVIASNIGLLAKEGKGKGVERLFVATDLLTGAPLKGARLTLFNFQNEPLAAVTTDDDGFARLSLDRPAFYLRADHNGDVGVLKLSRSGVLPLTHFDVGGGDVASGLKGALYAERGVWRPGDDMYLTFVLQDPAQTLPPQHPIKVTLKDPNDSVVSSFLLRRAVGGFYPFTLSTPEEAVTGFWSVTVKVGDREWTQALRVEDIMPNRLQVNLSFPKERLTRADFPVKGKLFSQWLHGAKARGLLSTVSASFLPRDVRFEAYPEFTFSGDHNQDPQRDLELFKGRLSDEGRGEFMWDIPSALSGDLEARFTTRVFEEGGGFSTEYSDVTLSLHDRYVGVRLPKGDERGMLLTDVPHQVLIKTLSPFGEPRDGAPLELKVYKLSWAWWWDKSAQRVMSYMHNDYMSPLQVTQLNTERGEGSWELMIKSPDWGRYLIEVCELPAGHCAAKIFYVDWPGWAGKTDEREVSATRLDLDLDAPRYTVGEVARLKLPAMPGGRALLSIEQGSRLVSQRWVQLGEQETVAEVPVTEGMAPNVHLSVTALQPYQRNNDRPLRLYGVKRMDVLDPKTHLAPTIEMPDEARPESEVVVRVAEERGSPMVYTLAVVDEGLLGLTRFRTPNLHSEFFKRVALSVRTWDLFDDVIGYAGKVERLLSIGGAEEISEDPDANKRRFPPVVRFMGPFELKAGERNEHRFTLPQYVGAVRAMLVAGRQGAGEAAYGSAEHKMLVRQPMMILANPPRVLGPSEEVLVPVSVFATAEDLTRVELFASISDPGSSITAREVVTFEQPREQERLAFLKLKVGARAGAQTMTLRAESGVWMSGQRVTLPVRLANPPMSDVERVKVAPGESATLSLRDFATPGTLSGVVELSSVPRLNLSEHLSYLIGYPHGCLEQTTSKAFPQLYLRYVMDLDGDLAAEAAEGVAQGIARLRQMQAPSGGFGYWPGEEAHEWGTSYVGHFLLEARRLGYHVPAEMISSFVSYQQGRAREWSRPQGQAGAAAAEEEVQAYRLLTLALARQPDLASMNRLRQGQELGAVARWTLARAYLLAGQREAAQELVALAPTAVGGADEARELMTSFRSRARDLGLILVSLVQLGDEERARAVSEELLAELDGEEEHSTRSTHSTHSRASALIAIGAWVSEGLNADGERRGFSWSMRVGEGPEVQGAARRVLWSRPLAPSELEARAVTIKNLSAAPLYASVVRRGVARAGEERAEARDLSLSVRYLNAKGEEVSPSSAPQGEHLTAVVVVKNTSRRSLGQLALSYGVPSGWEIENERLGAAAAPAPVGAREGGLYQDIRDDRVLSYFELKPGAAREVRVRVIAAYAGRFYHPATLVEAMYAPSSRALTPGFWAEVVR